VTFFVRRKSGCHKSIPRANPRNAFSNGPYAAKVWNLARPRNMAIANDHCDISRAAQIWLLHWACVILPCTCLTWPICGWLPGLLLATQLHQNQTSSLLPHIILVQHQNTRGMQGLSNRRWG
jgi:hypothetical protein